MNATAPSRVSVADILDRARSIAGLTKSAGIGKIPEDPSKSPVAIPPADPTPASLPSESKPMNSTGTDVGAVPMPETNPSPSGEGKVPAVEDGTKKEDMIAPNTSTAELLKSATAKARSLLNIQTPAPAAPAAPAAAPAVTSKEAAATEPQLELTEAYHAKIASVLLSTEGGRRQVAAMLDTIIGTQESVELIKEASAMQARFEEIGAVTLQQQEAYRRELEAVEMQKVAFAKEVAKLPEEDRKRLFLIEDAVKQASVKYKDVPNGQLFEQWIIKGASDMGAMMGDPAMAAAMQGGGAMPEMPAEGGGAGAGGVEELLMLLEQLVASGEVTEEEAMQVAELLMQESAGAAPGGELQKAASAAVEAIVNVDKAELVKAAAAI